LSGKGQPSAAIGGQAVIEGVMMRGKQHWSLAVRKPDGDIFIKTEELTPLALKYPVFKWPVLRGVIALWESMALGMKALSISASVSVEEEDFTISKKEMVLSFGLGILLAVALFVVLPLYATKQVEGWFPNSALFILAEGLLRILILILYILVVSRIKQLRRLFEYHGAEHKTIHALEHGLELDAANVERFSPLHPRCGTSFLLIVMVLAIIVFSFVGIPSLIWLVISRLIGIPLIIGLAYEVIKYAGKHTDSKFMSAVMYPGLLLQRLTTREPDLGEIEVAIKALEGVISREPIELDHSGAADLEVMA
jgi:uncharacterized protein YqhQ